MISTPGDYLMDDDDEEDGFMDDDGEDFDYDDTHV